MKFNALKCKFPTITCKKSPVTTNYHLGDANLQRVQQEKDLGIMINANLSWDAHIFSVFNRANKMLGLLKRTCPLIEHSKIRQTLYHVFVKSQLCHATEVWSPATAKLQMTLERVQRRATRWILKTNVGEMTYEDRLTTPNHLPLVSDRELRNLVLVIIDLSLVVLT